MNSWVFIFLFWQCYYAPKTNPKLTSRAGGGVYISTANLENMNSIRTPKSKIYDPWNKKISLLSN